MAPSPRSRLKALPDLRIALSALRGTPQLTPLATSLLPLLSPSRPALESLLPPLLALFRTGLLEQYYPPGPVATLALSTAASFLLHVFNVELPLCWDLEGGRKEGRRWKEGREEEGRAWEEVLGSVLLGFETHLRTGDEIDPATEGSVKDQPYRTAFGSSVFSPLIALLASENAWRTAPRHRYAILDTLGEAIAKHSPNKILLRSLLPFSFLASLISDGSDRLLTNCAFELAYRLISGSKSEKAAWAGEIFTLEVFGEDAEELRESFVNLSGSGFFQGAREMLDSLSRKNIARAQAFATPFILYNQTKLFPDEASTTPWWICHDFLAAIVDIERGGELVEARFVIDFATVQRVEVEAQQGRNAFMVTFFLSEPVTLSNVPIDDLTNEIHHKAAFRPPFSSLPSLHAALTSRALKYPTLALPSSNRKASDAPPISASYVQRSLKPSSSLPGCDVDEQSLTRERADHLASIAEVDGSERASSQGSAGQEKSEAKTPGQVKGRLEVDSRAGLERRPSKGEEETSSQSQRVGKDGDESSVPSEIESDDEVQIVEDGRKASREESGLAAKSRAPSSESDSASTEEAAPAPAFVLVSPAATAKAEATTKAKNASPPRKVVASPSLAGSQESSDSRPRRTTRTSKKLDDKVSASRKSKPADGSSLRMKKPKPTPAPQANKSPVRNFPIRTTRSRAARSSASTSAPSLAANKRSPSHFEALSETSVEPAAPVPHDQPPYPKRRKITDPSPLDRNAMTATTLVESQVESEPCTLAVAKEKKVTRTYGKKLSPIKERGRVEGDTEKGKVVEEVEESMAEEEPVVVKTKTKAKAVSKAKGKGKQKDVEMDVDSSVEQEGRRQTRGAKAAAKRAAETEHPTQSSTLSKVIVPSLPSDTKSTKLLANPNRKQSTVLVAATPDDQDPSTKSSRSPSPELVVQPRTTKTITSFSHRSSLLHGLVLSRPEPAPHSPSPEAQPEPLRHSEEENDDDIYDVPDEPMPPPRQQPSSIVIGSSSHATSSHLKNIAVPIPELPARRSVAPLPPKAVAGPRKSVGGTLPSVQISPRRGKEVRGEKSPRKKEVTSPRREEEEGSEMDQVRSTLEGLVSVIIARARKHKRREHDLFEQSVERLNKKALRFLEELHEETEEIVVGAKGSVKEAEQGAKRIGEMVRRFEEMRAKA